LESFALASVGNITKGALVVGVDPEKEVQLTEMDQKIIKGNFFGPDDKELILTEGIADYLGVDINDTVILIGAGYHGSSAAGKYPVTGILKFNSPELNKTLLFLPLKEAQWLFDAADRVTALIVMTDPEKLFKVTTHLEETLGDDYEVMNWREMLPEIVQAIEADNIGGIIVLAILYLIVGFGILGTILMMVAERKYEFGVLIAVGMKRYKLLVVLIIESFFLTLLGVISGIAVSLPLVTYFHFNPIPLGDELAQGIEKYGLEAILPFSINPEIFIYQALTVLIIGFVVSVYPVYRVLRVKPAEAMRS